MADWLQLLPGETVVCRSRLAVKNALVLAIGVYVIVAITVPMGQAALTFFLDGDAQLRSQFIRSLGGAFGVALLAFVLVYGEEFVVTDHRVLKRQSPIVRVLIRDREMRLRDIAEMKAWTGPTIGRWFRLISNDGGSLDVILAPDLDRLRGALIRETGLPDPFSG